MPQNINRAESEGMEGAFYLNPNWGVSIRGVHPYLDAHDLSRSDLLLRRPRRQRVNVNYSPIRALNLNVAMNVTGTRWDVDPIRFTNCDNGGYIVRLIWRLPMVWGC